MSRRLVLVSAIPLLAAWLAAAGSANRESPALSLAERLGYDADARLLIVHADDLGLGNSVNQATFAALKSGGVNSVSIMVNCPWMPQVAAAAKEHPEWDLGIHLTLNAEWATYKWGPVAPLGQVSSLTDPAGYLYATLGEAVEAIDPAEAAIEIRAQIERARAMGIEPTHLDSHMGTLFRSPRLFTALLEAGRHYGLPVLIPKNLLSMAPFAAELLTDWDIPIDNLVALFPAHPRARPDTWAEAYGEIISNLGPGVSQLIVHLGFDGPELQAITEGHPDFGSAWRQRDFDFVTSRGFADLLEREGIRKITWREIGKLVEDL